VVATSIHSWMRANQEHQPIRLKTQHNGHCHCAIASQKGAKSSCVE